MTCGSLVFFFKDTATTEIYPLSRHDALPIFALGRRAVEARPPPAPPTADGRAGALGQEGLERVFEAVSLGVDAAGEGAEDRKSTRLNSSHANISYAVFCLKKKNTTACTSVSY